MIIPFAPGGGSDSPRNAERLVNQGIEVVASGPAELADYLKAEIAKWDRVIQAAGIAAQ